MYYLFVFRSRVFSRLIEVDGPRDPDREKNLYQEFDGETNTLGPSIERLFEEELIQSTSDKDNERCFHKVKYYIPPYKSELYCDFFNKTNSYQTNLLN